MSARATCLIDGCKHTTGRFESEWICAKHWRQLVPPRSRLRRAYHAFHRRGAKLGWPAAFQRRYWRFWDALVRCARRRNETGHIDEVEINRLMGW